MDIHCFANGEKNFAKVSEEEIEEAVFYPSDLVNTNTTIPLGVGEELWIYTLTLHVSVYIYPPLFTSPSEDSCILYYQWRGDKSVLFSSANYTAQDAAGRGKGFK